MADVHSTKMLNIWSLGIRGSYQFNPFHHIIGLFKYVRKKNFDVWISMVYQYVFQGIKSGLVQVLHSIHSNDHYRCRFWNLFSQLLKLTGKSKNNGPFKCLINTSFLSSSGKFISSAQPFSSNKVFTSDRFAVKSPIFFMNIREGITSQLPTAYSKFQWKKVPLQLALL